MLYLALGAAALAVFVWLGRRGRPVFQRPGLRVLSGVASIAAFAGAAFLAVRGGWAFAPVLVVLGLWLAMSARSHGAAGGPAPRTSGMSETEARSILGVEAEAGPEEIQAAYTRLMRRAHPDAGGSAGLAAQLNAARDRLIRR
ncbi:molecular chaperone DnaJ [Phenylobacterium sp.]|uniref:molecular chaperone DnaJ n=1 Tax=Phenylobacterium sp. TaxID=1871053 RepID=UPI0027312F7B|nr:molecular chaperone DnaJ [Phenylobacterium sp.]MDP1616551.1 molecular chaperone DnaJ [Phenylobacterium sp.]MDP1987805.1 molecular chaperone DnaJ [Phenylobacterium sp.]